MVALNWKVYYSIIIQIFQEIAIYSKQSLAAAIFHSVGTGYIQPPQQVASDILNCSSNILLGKALIANTAMMCSHSTIQRYYGMGKEAGRFVKRLATKMTLKNNASDYSTNMSFVRRRLRFDLLRSTLIALRGFRGKIYATRPTNIADIDLELERNGEILDM